MSDEDPKWRDDLPEEIFSDPDETGRPHEPSQALVRVEEPEPAPEVPTTHPYDMLPASAIARAGTLAMTKAQLDVLLEPVKPEEVLFRWGDDDKSYALAYVPQTHVRRRLLRAFYEVGVSLVPVEAPKVIKLPKKGTVVAYHGALVVNGCLVAEATGQCKYAEANRGMAYTDALEGAKSDCWVRCSKDLGAFGELWDKNFTAPLEEAWRKAQVEEIEARPKCPKCGRGLDKSRFVEGEWYCYAKKGGCGWQGIPKLPESPAPVAQPTVPPVPATSTPAYFKGARPSSSPPTDIDWSKVDVQPLVKQLAKLIENPCIKLAEANHYMDLALKAPTARRYTALIEIVENLIASRTKESPTHASEEDR